MAMSARILLIFCFLVACQEGPQLALDPVADGSVDAGPEALELTRLWVTALPPLPAIHFEEEDRTYPLKLWHRIAAAYDPPTLFAEFANATPPQPIYARFEFRFDELLLSCVQEKELGYLDGAAGTWLTLGRCQNLDPENPTLTSEQIFGLEQVYPLGELRIIFTSEGFASTSRTHQIRLCSTDMRPQELPGNECDLREPE
mgnify:CR=1 FL=1